MSFSATGPTMWALRWSLASFLLRQQVTFPKINFITLVIPSLVVTWSFEALNSNFSTRIVKFDTYNALWEVYTHSMYYSQTTHIITIITNFRPALPPGQLSSQQRVWKLRGELWARLWWRPHSNIQSGGESICIFILGEEFYWTLSIKLSKREICSFPVPSHSHQIELTSFGNFPLGILALLLIIFCQPQPSTTEAEVNNILI